MTAVDTLRVSVTDRCNLRCVYCMPPEGIKTKSHGDILRFEEIERIARAAVRGGVRKVRLTGGEPLARRDIERLVGLLSTIDGLRDLAMTTNGTLLARKARALMDAGLDRVTVSLDSLDPAKYTDITRGASLDSAIEGIDKAIEAGLTPVKVNVVVMRGVNDGEALDFVEFAGDRDLHVRFIELMPISPGDGNICSARSGEISFVPWQETFAAIDEAWGKLEPVENGSGPARLFSIPGGKGAVGFISPVSKPFCSGCTRMRLTADGKLRACLFSNVETDLIGLIRNGADDEEIYRVFMEAVKNKPKRTEPAFKDNKRWMAQIGG